MPLTVWLLRLCKPIDGPIFSCKSITARALCLVMSLPSVICNAALALSFSTKLGQHLCRFGIFHTTLAGERRIPIFQRKILWSRKEKDSKSDRFSGTERRKALWS